MERSKLNKEKYLRRKKKAPESRLKLSSVFKEINRLRNEIKGVLISEQDLTQLSFQLVKRN